MDVFLDFPPLPQALELIADLSDEEFERLKTAIAGDVGFPTSFARCKAIAQQVGSEISINGVQNILRSLQFLRNRTDEGMEDDGPEAVYELFEYVGLDKVFDRHKYARLYARVGRLLRPTPAAETYYQREWLKSGLIDTAVDLDWFVDLRARFSEDQSAVEELVPVVIFRLVLANDRGEEKAQVFQLTAEMLATFETGVRSIDEQLEVIERLPFKSNSAAYVEKMES